jgi:hypothetical protein
MWMMNAQAIAISTIVATAVEKVAAVLIAGHAMRVKFARVQTIS